MDTLLFLVAAVFGLLVIGGRLESSAPPVPGWHWRWWPSRPSRRWWAVVALFTVAVHRPPRITGRVFALSVLAALVSVVARPEPGRPWLVLFLFGVAIQGATVGWGLFIHSRPDASSEEIAGAAKVIRENAHHALQDLREVIGVLRAPVGELPQPTLADVRQLVAESGRAGMRVELREEVGGAVPDLVGRTAYRVVEALTNDRKHAPGAAVDVHLAGAPGQGLTVEVCNQPPGPADPGPADPGPADPGPADPGTAGAPHPDPPLPGPPVGEGSPAASSGPGVVHSPGTTVAPGQGLVGLAERVALASGRLEHGATPDGGWRLAAWLPWPA